jgi:Ser/Thr protein kinase RdoA (MazF antagonist)
MDFPADDAFSALSPDLIMDAVELSGRKPSGQFSQLNSLENRVFSVSTEDARIVLKFYRNGRWSDEAILEEHGFIRELGDAGAPVCPALVLTDGTTLMQAGPFRFSAWEGFRGRIADEFDESMLFQAGRALAQIHSVGSRSSFSSRPPFSAESLILRPLKQLKESGAIPADILPTYEECAMAAASALDKACSSMPSHRIHGDFHWGNILWDGSAFKILDFDDACVGPASQDIWMIAPAQDKEGESKREIMLSGYRTYAPSRIPGSLPSDRSRRPASSIIPPGYPNGSGNPFSSPPFPASVAESIGKRNSRISRLFCSPPFPTRVCPNIS